MYVQLTFSFYEKLFNNVSKLTYKSVPTLGLISHKHRLDIIENIANCLKSTLEGIFLEEILQLEFLFLQHVLLKTIKV